MKALEYITAFAPDDGESVNDLVADMPAGTPVPPILPTEDGLSFILITNNILRLSPETLIRLSQDLWQMLCRVRVWMRPMPLSTARHGR